jgi:hypothetical protein
MVVLLQVVSVAAFERPTIDVVVDDTAVTTVEVRFTLGKLNKVETVVFPKTENIVPRLISERESTLDYVIQTAVDRSTDSFVKTFTKKSKQADETSIKCRKSLTGKTFKSELIRVFGVLKRLKFITKLSGSK